MIRHKNWTRETTCCILNACKHTPNVLIVLEITLTPVLFYIWSNQTLCCRGRSSPQPKTLWAQGLKGFHMSALGSLELQCDTQASNKRLCSSSVRMSLLSSIMEAGGAGTHTPTDIFHKLFLLRVHIMWNIGPKSRSPEKEQLKHLATWGQLTQRPYCSRPLPGSSPEWSE